MKLKLLFTTTLVWISLCLSAQQLTVNGQVTDSKDGSPMPGVNVTIDKTMQGTITNVDGNFTIKVDDPSAVLVFSFLGYTTQKVTLGTQTSLTVSLIEDVMKLDEVVVTGYGTSKKKDLTGSVSTLKADDLNKSVSSAEQMLQGKVTGVSVVSNNGEPGAGTNITIRGASSIRSGGQPLYVIDGIPLSNAASSPDGASAAGLSSVATSPLTFINPSDIESIDILKDASAAAIYGSRGANGVVIITTKKGSEGQNEVNYSTSLSISNLPKKLDVLSADEWLKLTTDSLKIADDKFGGQTDWQDQIFRTAYSNDHNLSLSGGTSKTTYRASFNYTDQQGIIRTSNMKRYAGRANFTQKALNDKVLFEANLSGSEVIENRVPVGASGFEGDLLLNAIMANPTWPAYDSTGMPFQGNKVFTFQANDRNPVAMLDYTKDLTRTSKLIGGLSATVEIIEGLHYKVNFGMVYTNANRFINQSQRLSYMKTSIGSGQINNRELYNYVTENTLNYNKTFGIHSIGLLAGYSYQESANRGANMTGGGYSTDGILYTNNIGTGGNAFTSISSYANPNDKLQSYFGRVNYNFKELVLLTTTLRADGSSKFGVNTKYGIFPSYAAAIRLSELEIIKNVSAISNLKLRVGYGKTGNSDISSENSQYLYAIDPGSKSIINGVVTSGYKISKTPNPDISWESTDATNLGLDFGVLKGRLSGTIDVFKKTTSNLLLEIPSTSTSPTSTVVMNIDKCKIENSGVEISITGVPIANNDITWEITGNITFQSNKVKDLPVKQYQTGSAQGAGLTGAYVQIVTSDQPMNMFYGKVVDSLGTMNTNKGKVYYQKGPDGKKDTLEYLGNPQPDFVWSLSNSFKYKMFDLSIFIDAVHGNSIFNNTAMLLDKANLKQAKNALRYFVEDKVAFNYSPEICDRYIEDGSYVRLSNVTLGANIPLSSTKWIKKLRVYVSGSNLFILTDYKGYNPDVNSSKDMNGVKSFGIDNTNYPKARTYMMGLNVSF